MGLQVFCSSVGLVYNENKDEIPYIYLFTWWCWAWLVSAPWCRFRASHWLLMSCDLWWVAVQLFWWFAMATCDLVLFRMAVQALCIVLFDKELQRGKRLFSIVSFLEKCCLFFCFMCEDNCSFVQLDNVGRGMAVVWGKNFLNSQFLSCLIST